ncbi:hypothetical protein VTK26DRAFT_339 [Humicola hyalothermophila]
MTLHYVQGDSGLKSEWWCPARHRVRQILKIALEAWIWHFLCFRVFDSHSLLWAGELGRDFSIQSERIRESVTSRPGQVDPTSAHSIIAQFHNWQVRSAYFIPRLTHGDHGRPGSAKGTAAEMLKLLMPFLSLGEPEHGKSLAFVDACQIVQEAIEMDSIFRMSKADFHVFITRLKLPLVSPPKTGFGFDPETMECTRSIPPLPRQSGDSVPTADLAVSPGILKAGNADGAHYDSERVLVKLQALYNLKAMLKIVAGDGEEMQDGRSTQYETEAFIKQKPGSDDEVCML